MIVAGSGSQLKYYLGNIEYSTNKNNRTDTKITLYIRQRDNDAHEKQNIEMIRGLTKKMRINFDVYEYPWNVMNVSMIKPSDNKTTALNLYFHNSEMTTLCGHEYIIFNNKPRQNIIIEKLNIIVEKWIKVCKPLYQPYIDENTK